MTELDEETIDTLKKITDVLKTTPFEINTIKLMTSGVGARIIDFDIRRKIEEE